MSEWKAKRFWKAAGVERVAEGWAVRLDDRPVRTPSKAELALPSEALARGVAAEWDAQEGAIDPLSMPLTRAANTTVDKVLPQVDAVVDELAGYGATDLLSYRAEGPDGLVARQAERWDPLLEWMAEKTGARLAVTAGVMAIDQDPAVLGALRARVGQASPWELTALSEFVTISGSLVIGLAAMEGDRWPASDLFERSRVDEDWQIEQWGEDEEEAARVSHRRAAFVQARTWLDLLRAG